MYKALFSLGFLFYFSTSLLSASQNRSYYSQYEDLPFLEDIIRSAEAEVKVKYAWYDRPHYTERGLNILLSKMNKYYSELYRMYHSPVENIVEELSFYSKFKFKYDEELTRMLASYSSGWGMLEKSIKKELIINFFKAISLGLINLLEYKLKPSILHKENTFNKKLPIFSFLRGYIFLETLVKRPIFLFFNESFNLTYYEKKIPYITYKLLPIAGVAWESSIFATMLIKRYIKPVKSYIIYEKMLQNLESFYANKWLFRISLAYSAYLIFDTLTFCSSQRYLPTYVMDKDIKAVRLVYDKKCQNLLTTYEVLQEPQKNIKVTAYIARLICLYFISKTMGKLLPT